MGVRQVVVHTLKTGQSAWKCKLCCAGRDGLTLAEALAGSAAHPAECPAVPSDARPA